MWFHGTNTNTAQQLTPGLCCLTHRTTGWPLQQGWNAWSSQSFLICGWSQVCACLSEQCYHSSSIRGTKVSTHEPLRTWCCERRCWCQKNLCGSPRRNQTHHNLPLLAGNWRNYTGHKSSNQSGFQTLWNHCAGSDFFLAWPDMDRESSSSPENSLFAKPSTFHIVREQVAVYKGAVVNDVDRSSCVCWIIWQTAWPLHTCDT